MMQLLQPVDRIRKLMQMIRCSLLPVQRFWMVTALAVVTHISNYGTNEEVGYFPYNFNN